MYIANYIIAYGGDLMDKKQGYTIKFVVNPWRYRNRRFKKTPKPIPRSRYAQYLWEIGAGWNE